MAKATQVIDEAKLGEFMGRFVGDLGAALSAALVVIGDRLGLYRAMADGEPVTAEELAGRTATDPRYVREWLSNQAAGGYVTYHSESDRFSACTTWATRWVLRHMCSRRSSRMERG